MHVRTRNENKPLKEVGPKQDKRKGGRETDKPARRGMKQEIPKPRRRESQLFLETQLGREWEPNLCSPKGPHLWCEANKSRTYVDDRVFELDMQPVVGDGNEGISCPAQEFHSLTL